MYERILEDRRRGMTAERGVAALSEESRSGGSRPAGSGSDRTRTRRFQRRYARECQTLRDGRWRWRPTDGRSETGPRLRRLEKWNTRCGQAEQTLCRAIFILRWLTRQRGVGPLPWPSPSAMRPVRPSQAGADTVGPPSTCPAIMGPRPPPGFEGLLVNEAENPESTAERTCQTLLSNASIINQHRHHHVEMERTIDNHVHQAKEETVHMPKITLQERDIQQTVKHAVEVPIPMTQEVRNIQQTAEQVAKDPTPTTQEGIIHAPTIVNHHRHHHV